MLVPILAAPTIGSREGPELRGDRRRPSESDLAPTRGRNLICIQ
jgi:hypothetical protein